MRKDPQKNREYQAKWYRENKEIQYARIKANKKRLIDWISEYKKTLKCSKCPENHPAALDFHHRNPEEKEGRIADLANKGWSVKRLMSEIEKCDVLCANCHRKLHWEERQTMIAG